MPEQYDMIHCDMFTCTQQLMGSQLNLPHGTRTKR